MELRGSKVNIIIKIAEEPEGKGLGFEAAADACNFSNACMDAKSVCVDIHTECMMVGRYVLKAFT